MRMKSFLIFAVALCLPLSLIADAMPKEDFSEKIPLPTEEVMADDCSGMKYRLSGGVPVYFFDDEDDTEAGGVYFDAGSRCHNWNLRIGAEIRHMDLEQDAAASFAEAPGRDVEVTYVRIPISAEYAMSLSDQATLYAGLGPDIVNLANDVGDTTVGFHLSARLHYALNEHWGIAVEGGYMWAEADGADGGDDINLDGAFVTPTISYTF